MKAGRKLRILHLQTGTGLEGGIAHYIGELVRSGCFGEFENFVAVAKTDGESDRLEALYRQSRLVQCPKRYGLAGLFYYIYRLKKLTQCLGIDVIHAHALRSALPASLVSLWSGIPLVYTNHGLRFTQKPKWISRVVFEWIERIVCGISFRVCAIRQYDICAMRQSGICVADKQVLVTTRIDGRAMATPVRSARNVRNVAIVVGIGSLIPVKRPQLFVDWVEQLAAKVDIRAVWLGDGPQRQELESRCKVSGVPVRFAGQVSRGDVKRTLASAKVLFVTSEFEVFPLAVIEAYEQGIPVVITRFAGVHDFVQDEGTGIVLSEHVSDPMLRVCELLTDPARWQAMSSAAKRAFDERFSNPEIMAETYARLYRAAAHEL